MVRLRALSAAVVLLACDVRHVQLLGSSSSTPPPEADAGSDPPDPSGGEAGSTSAAGVNAGGSSAAGSGGSPVGGAGAGGQSGGAAGMGGQAGAAGAGGQMAAPPCTEFGPWMTLEPVEGLGSPDENHFGPSLTNEPTVLFFSVGIGEEEEIWRATRESPSDPFSGAMAVPEVNTDTMDGTPYITPDGQSLWFASTREGGQGDRDIWMAEGGVNGFAAAINVAEVNSEGLEHLPSMTADGLILMFSSNRVSGNEDLYMATRASTVDSFEEPFLVEELSTDFYDGSPAITPDGLTVYFASKRVGNEDNDIYVSTRASLDDPFEEPVLIEELSSVDNEEDPRLAPSRLEIFFSTNRDTGVHQIWHAQRECLDL